MITDNDHRNGIDAHTENCFGAKGIDMWTIWTIFTWSPPLLSATGWLLLFKLGDLIKIQLIYLFGCAHFPHLVDHKNNKSTLFLFQLNIGNLKVHTILDCQSPLHLVQCSLCLFPPRWIALKTVSLTSGFFLSSTTDVRSLAVLHLVVGRILFQDNFQVDIVAHLFALLELR